MRAGKVLRALEVENEGWVGERDYTENGERFRPPVETVPLSFQSFVFGNSTRSTSVGHFTRSESR